MIFDRPTIDPAKNDFMRQTRLLRPSYNPRNDIYHPATEYGSMTVCT